MLIRYIKKKIRNMIISKGVDIMANTAENYLDEKTTGKVNEVINLTTILKQL